MPVITCAMQDVTSSQQSGRAHGSSVMQCSRASGTLQNTSLGNICGTATPFFYSTETGQRKISLIGHSVFVFIRCYMMVRVVQSV